jgi:hypothetical protein
MSRPFIQIHNATTGEVVFREMNDDEFAQYQTNEAFFAAEAAEKAAQAEAKAALLAQLGITEEQAKLLLS